MNLKHKISEREVHNINSELAQGVVNRASETLLVMAILFSIYGIMSSSIISKYDPSITMWANTWPRILLNGIPFALLAFFLRKTPKYLNGKVLLWAIVQPIIFMIACNIHVWPIMIARDLEIYKYFHAANMFVITFGLTFVAPPRSIMLVQVASYTLFFLIPLLYITRSDQSLMSMIINDYICMTTGACVAGHLTYRLRRRVAFMDAQIKSQLTPLVGEAVASAIYNNDLYRLNNRKSLGLILSIDLRGYTQFLQMSPKEVSSAFMKEYHFMVSSTVGKFGGFTHKTAGDSHLISFGLMDGSADLSDIPELREEVMEAEMRKIKVLVETALHMFEELIDKYLQLKLRYDIADDLRVGAALASGMIEIQIQGDQNYHQEVNIVGDTIVRSVRLEAYTKFLMSHIAPTSCMLIISPEIIEKLDLDYKHNIKSWTINNNEQHVRDYPHIRKLYYKIWLPSHQYYNKKQAS